jgi:ribonuclease P protein component
MLPREHRLRQSGDFARVRQQGKTFAHPWFVVAVTPNGTSITRVGFIVSKRLGKAHVRNRVKRVLRTIVRQYLPGLAPGFDVVVITRPALVGQRFAAIDEVLRRQLQLARLVTRPHSPIAQSK